MSELFEGLEATENTFSPESAHAQMELYQQAAQEALDEGAKDMADYYQSRLEALQREQKSPAGQEISFGALLTESRYLEYADAEYDRNGNSVEYRRLIGLAKEAAKEEQARNSPK